MLGYKIPSEFSFAICVVLGRASVCSEISYLKAKGDYTQHPALFESDRIPLSHSLDIVPECECIKMGF